MKKRSVWKLVLLLLVVLAVVLPLAASATETLQFGNGNPQWPTNWVALPELNDPVDDNGVIRSDNDFVGGRDRPGSVLCGR